MNYNKRQRYLFNWHTDSFNQLEDWKTIFFDTTVFIGCGDFVFLVWRVEIDFKITVSSTAINTHDCICWQLVTGDIIGEQSTEGGNWILKDFPVMALLVSFILHTGRGPITE